MRYYIMITLILAHEFFIQIRAMDYDSDDETRKKSFIVSAPRYEAARAALERAISGKDLAFTIAFFQGSPEQINQINCMGITVLHALAQLSNEKLACDAIDRLFKSAKQDKCSLPDLHVKTHEGKTPAVCAYEAGNKRICELLYEYGASNVHSIMQEFITLDFNDDAAEAAIGD